MKVKRGWIGFDLDGTLANTRTPTENLQSIGEPIPDMIKRLKDHLKKGWKVKILTARANDPRQIPLIQQWLKDCNLPSNIEITSKKDYDMICFYDDRAITVERNTGRVVIK